MLANLSVSALDEPVGSLSRSVLILIYTRYADELVFFDR